MKEFIIILIIAISIVMILLTILWFGRWINKSIQKGYEIEDARRREGIKQGIAEYLEAKRKWEEKGDNHVS